ncbi:MAG: DNA internalization-related competence protein ComEC/Rec2 [Candidatus Gastranaerophilales bacterium]|nr:DNA internalization-related competence protein ComEC/Rec2 [Candidatus Gastranaerophilales bacterium]
MNKKLSVVIFIFFYMLGLISFLTDHILCSSVLIFLLLVICLVKQVFSEKYAVILFLVFALGILNCSLRFKNSDDLTPLTPCNDVTIVGTVVSMPSNSSSDYTKFNFKTEKYKLFNRQFEPVNAVTLVTLSAPKNIYANLETGDKLTITGRLVRPRTASNPSEFCYSTFLKFKGIHTRFFADKEDFVLTEKPQKKSYKFLANLNRIRTKIIDIHAQNIKSPQLELLGGIVFGDDVVTPVEDMKVSFQKSGLTHIIAASGMNVSMIFGMWFFISQILRLNYKFSILAGIFAVICYTCMTGFGPPVLRASLMLILVLLGKLADKKANSVNLLFIVAFLMCLFSPSMITNIAFQLSFAVTFGLLLCYQLFFENIKSKFINILISVILVPVIAQLFASPIQMFYFNSFSPYSVFANIAVVPTLSIVSFGGFISCIFALIKPISYIVIKGFDWVLLPFLTFITNVADYFSHLPFANITVPSPSVFQIILYYAALLGLIFYFSDREKYKKFLLSSIISFLILLVSFINFGSKGSEIIFFSVDNADAALIKTSKNKYCLIDTGKAPYNKFSPAAQRVILKYFEDKGINSLDLLILSHYDSDHAGGTLTITDKIAVKELVVRSVDDKSPLALQILDDAKNRNIKVTVPENSELLLDDGENKIYAFYADKGDDNDTSLVNLFETPDGKALFTGDCSASALHSLQKYLPQKIEILKAAHHGAKGTLSDDILSYINADAAIISTGFNIYGHPDGQTVDLLKKHKVKVLRTDLDNAVKVVFSKNKILLYSYNNRYKKFVRIDK